MVGWDRGHAQPPLQRTHLRPWQAFAVTGAAEAARGGADVAALAASQRQVAAPEAAVSANQLIVTALSTTARGLDTVAQAATANDEDLLTLGLTTLSDGAKLSERATAAAADAGAGCPPE